MKLSKIFRHYQRIILSGLIVLFALLGLFLGVVPLIQKSLVINGQITELSADIGALEAKLSVLGGLDEDTLRVNLETLLSAIPSDKSLASLMGTIDGLTAQTGVAVSALALAKPGSLATASARKLSADEQVVGSSILPFTVHLTGSFDQIRAFLASAVRVRRSFRIRSFDMTLQGATSVTANVAMDAFYAPIPSAIGSVLQTIGPLEAKDNQVIERLSGLPLLVQMSAPVAPSAGAGKADPFSL